jgi:hypothetical protein
MSKYRDENEWTKLQGPFGVADLRALAPLGLINKLSITERPLLTIAISIGFASLKSVSHLWLWCKVTRGSMRYILSIPDLQVLDILGMRHPGKLAGFSTAESLQVLRCNTGMSSDDLIEIATSRSIKDLGAQSATLTTAAMSALIAMPSLESLDIEGSNFDDVFAEQISASRSLLSLDVGATRLTRKGLRHLCRMKQLKSLDLWASDIEEADIALLGDLPHLEYLSIGHQLDGETNFDADTLLPKLKAIKSLARVWIDGVPVSAQTRKKYEKHFESVKISD